MTGGPGKTIGLLGAVVLVGVFATLAYPASAEESAGQRMRQGMQKTACLACHSNTKDSAKLVDVNRCCDAHCQQCHGPMEKHHPVGADVTETDKVPLPLLNKNRVGCISCHDPASPSSDTRSWKSQSLFSRVFQSQKSYKTYYLRINNSSGDLCKTCH